MLQHKSDSPIDYWDLDSPWHLSHLSPECRLVCSMQHWSSHFHRGTGVWLTGLTHMPVSCFSVTTWWHRAENYVIMLNKHFSFILCGGNTEKDKPENNCYDLYWSRRLPEENFTVCVKKDLTRSQWREASVGEKWYIHIHLSFIHIALVIASVMHIWAYLLTGVNTCFFLIQN